MYVFARAKFHRLGALHNRNPHSHGSEGWKPKMKKLAALLRPGPLVGMLMTLLLLCSHAPLPLQTSRLSLCANHLFLEGQPRAG